jgi:hypothetical protein
MINTLSLNIDAFGRFILNLFGALSMCRVEEVETTRLDNLVYGSTVDEDGRWDEGSEHELWQRVVEVKTIRTMEVGTPITFRLVVEASAEIMPNGKASSHWHYVLKSVTCDVALTVEERKHLITKGLRSMVAYGLVAA